MKAGTGAERTISIFSLAANSFGNQSSIFQKPNPLFITAAIGYSIQWLTHGSISTLAYTVFTMAIVIWAYEEAATGVNPFRRLLGVAVLIAMMVSLFEQLQ